MAPKSRSSSGSDSDSSGSGKRHSGGKKTEEYRMKRDRNNVAVRKSRERSRQKAKETMEKVSRLKRENEDLEMKVKLLSKELNLLKDLFLNHAGNGSDFPLTAAQLIVPKVEVEVHNMNSNGETDADSDGSLDMYSLEGSGAGTPANIEVVQRDHEYSAMAPGRVAVQ